MARNRKQAVDQGRAMVRVTGIHTGQVRTAAVCPGCWNTPVGRERLLEGFKRKGLLVCSRTDGRDGRYETGRKHAPGCPYRD